MKATRSCSPLACVNELIWYYSELTLRLIVLSSVMRMLDAALTDLPGIVSFGRVGSARPLKVDGPTAGVGLSEDPEAGGEAALGLSV
jgi:hypothetical protein